MGGREAKLHTFLTLTIGGGEYLVSGLGHLSPEKEHCYVLDRRLAGPQRWCGQCGEVKSIASAGNKTVICLLYS
jgi:hypothetical protein